MPETMNNLIPSEWKKTLILEKLDHYTFYNYTLKEKMTATRI